MPQAAKTFILPSTNRRDLIDIQFHTTLPGHNNPVYAVCADPDTGNFFTAGNDRGIVEWTPGSTTPRRLLKPVPASVYVLGIYRRRLYAGLRNGQILYFDLEHGNLAGSLGQPGPGVFDLLLLPDKNELLSAAEDGRVCVWDLHNGKLLHSWQVSGEKIRTMALDALTDTLAVGANDGIISIYDTRDYSLQSAFTAHTLGITALAFSPDGQRLLSGSRDAHIKAWRPGNWDNLADFAAHYFSVYRILYHPSMNVFLSISRDKSFKLWDAAGYRLLKNISLEKGHPSHRLSVNNAAWLQRGKQLVTVSDDRLAIVWDIKNRTSVI